MRLQLRHDGPRHGAAAGTAACGHAWAGAHLPMEREALARLLLGTRCPACGGESHIRVLEARDMTVSEALAGT